MKKAIFAVSFLAVLANCTPVSVGGSGTSKDGSPVALSIVRSADGAEYDITLVKPGKWTCKSATLTQENNATPGTNMRQFPLSCGNGLKGTAIMTLDQFKEEAVLSFNLSNGDSGQAKIGG